MKVTRLDHFGVDVTDLARAERFDECLYFLDPDGNLLELVGYRPHRRPE